MDENINLPALKISLLKRYRLPFLPLHSCGCSYSREPDKVLSSSKNGVLSAASTTAFSAEPFTSLSVVAAVSVSAVPIPSIIGLEWVGFMDGKLSVPSDVSSVVFSFFFLAELRRKVSNCCPLKRNIRTPSYALTVGDMPDSQ